MTKKETLLRLATLLFPPLGLVLLWRSAKRLSRKLIGTLGILLYSLLYAALVIFLLIRFTGLEVEWPGGYLPSLTYHKSRPNYDALDRDRAARKAGPEKPQPNTPAAAYWTGFRGPLHDGHYEQTPILTNWPAGGLRVLWRQPCGGGYSSFAIAEGLAFTLEQRRDQEVLVAYSVEDGHQAWKQNWPAEFRDFYAEGGPRSTPTCSDGYVYALGALGTLHCVEAATGKAVWAHEILAENHGDVPTYGLSASPLIVGDKLIVLSASGAGHSVLCYDKRSGKTLWSALDDRTGYASPTLLEVPGIIVCCESRTIGLEPETGKVLWSFPWHVKNNQLPIAQPLSLGSNRFLLSAGYFTGSAAVELTNTASAWITRTLWQNTQLKNKFTSSVYWQGFIYGLDEDILVCLDASTGERKWKAGRYGYGQVLLADRHLIILTGEGELALVAATPDGHKELARFQAIHGKTWNHPAIADGRLFVRNSAEMACFKIRPE